MVPNMKIQFVHIQMINQAHAHYCKIVGKVLRNQWKTCAHKNPVPNLVLEYKVETLYLGMDTVPKFWLGYLE